MQSDDNSKAFDVHRSVDVLQRTPDVLHAMLSGVSSFWARSNYGESTFSPFDVVGHLIEAERFNWMVRVRLIVEQGAAASFPPFDRYAMLERSKNKSMGDLLNEFAQRLENLSELQVLNLTPEKLELRGMHPELGEVVLRQLIAAWVVHDLGHTHQIAKAMAFQYRDEVGPWAKFLTILPRP